MDKTLIRSPDGEQEGNGDIEVRVVFLDREHAPAGLVADVLRALCDSALASELTDLEDCRSEFPELPSVAVDAATYRLRENRGTTVLVQAIRKGSVEVFLIVSGLGYFLLKQTLGETLKAAWLETPAHMRLKKFLSSRSQSKAEGIASSTRGKLLAKSDSKVETRIQKPNSPEQPIVIVVNVFPAPDNPDPPTRGRSLR